MKYWIRPANINYYDIFNSFKELNIVDWTSHNNYSIGDIVFFYCTLPIQRITHKCKVVRVDIPSNELIDDSKYIIDKSGYKSESNAIKYVRLELLEEIKGKVQLEDINIDRLQGAIMISEFQVNIIEEKGQLLTIRDKVYYQYEQWRNNNKKDIENREKEVNGLIDKFLKKFTKDQILDMSLDDYVEGKESKDSFCYWIENSLKPAGDIHGATSYKFGIYYSKKHGDYEIQTPKFPNNKELAFKEIRESIIDVIDASTNHDLDKITNSKLSNMFKNKITYLYNRNDYLPIYSDDDIKNF